MERADLEALESWAGWFDEKELTGHAAKNLRAAIAELTELREACNAAAKRIEVLERECMASRVFDKHQAKPIHRDNYGSMIDAQTRLLAARRATDENGGLGA